MEEKITFYQPTPEEREKIRQVLIKALKIIYQELDDDQSILALTMLKENINEQLKQIVIKYQIE